MSNPKNYSRTTPTLPETTGKGRFIILNIFDLILHIDTNLASAAGEYGLWIYLLLFVIMFVETGFVVTPFLPGDSLLFVAGALAEGGIFDLTTLFIVCCAGAILGDTVNYWIGARVGESAIQGRFAAFIHKEWIDRTHSFFCRYGGLTIIIARFIPYLRTFAPFLAGLGEMRYRSFVVYNVVGGILWTGGILLAGYYFGGLPIIRDNLTFLMLIVLVLCALAVVMMLHRIIALSLAKKNNGG